MRSALAEHLLYKLGSQVLSKIILRVGSLPASSWFLTSHSMSGGFNAVLQKDFELHVSLCVPPATFLPAER